MFLLFFELVFLSVELCEYFRNFDCTLLGKAAENTFEDTRGTAPSQRARRPPRKLPLLGPLRKYGAYVIQGMREMTVIRCLIVEKKCCFRER